MNNIEKTCQKNLEEEIRRIEEFLSNRQGQEYDDLAKEDRFCFDALDYYSGRTAKKRRADCQEALERIGRGTFGICLTCGKKIPDERLLVWPFAKRCCSCQQKRETRII